MKNPYRYFLLILLLVFVSAFHCYAQSARFKRDTVYVLYLYGTLENGRPVNNSLIYKDLSFFKDLTQIKDEDEFLCAMFKHGIIYMDFIETSIFKHKEQYHFADKKELHAFELNLQTQENNLYKTGKDFITQKFSNNKRITINIAKAGGEFWMDPIKPDYIYPVSESFEVRRECYSYDYLYSPKSLDKIYTLYNQDIDAITVLLTPEKKH